MYSNLFSDCKIGGLTLKNRLTMAPLYLGYAGEGGTVSAMLVDHYRLMAQSGAAMIVVENATVDYELGSVSTRTIRADTDNNLEGLKRLAEAIKQNGALACLQINHAGRFASAKEPVAPSSVETFKRFPKALSIQEIETIISKYADAALRVKRAGFDMVELHGGTGYLLAQFISPRTNKRTDEYGGSLENRLRFPLDVVKKVQDAVGDFPIGYRFLADEWLPDGLHLEESVQAAQALSDINIAYLSVMGGTYESFFLPEIIEKSKKEGYMLDLAAAVKSKVKVPVIAAGRISSGKTAEKAISDHKTDLIGLARVLWADAEWIEKVKTGRENEIIHCNPDCGDACMYRVMKKKPAYCVQWHPEKIKTWKAKFE